MTYEQIIHQLELVIRDADGLSGEDIEALTAAIIEVKRREVISFCHLHGSCYVCPLEDKRTRDLCVFPDELDENELDRVLADIRALDGGGERDCGGE